MRTSDDGDVGRGAAVAADDAADAFQRRARQVPGADVVGDQDGALRNVLKADIVLAEQGQTNLAADRLHVVGAGVEIRIVDRTEFGGEFGGGGNDGGDGIGAAADHRLGVANQGVVGGKVTQRGDNATIATGKPFAGQCLVHARLHNFDGMAETHDLGFGFLR